MANLSRLVVLVFALVAVLTIARYEQKLRLVTASEIQSPEDSSPFPSEYLARLPETAPLVPLAPAPATLTRPQVETLLQLYPYFGAQREYGRLLQYLTTKHDGEWQVGLVVEHVDRSMRESIAEALSEGRYEDARVNAQRVLNIIDALPPGTYLSDYVASFARKARILAEGALVDSDKDATTWMIGALNESSNRMEPAFVERTQGRVRELALYLDTAVAAQQLQPSEQRLLWQAFARDHTPSALAAEAHFNALNASMNAYREIPRKNPERIRLLTQLSRDAMNACYDFARAFPKSYLADDALRYAMRLAFSVGDKGEVMRAYSRLAVGYPGSDSYTQVAAGLAAWLVASEQHSPPQAETLVTFMAGIPRSAPGTTLGTLVLEHGDQGPLVLRKISIVLSEGLDGTQRQDAREILTRLLFKWLYARQGEQGVNALWDTDSNAPAEAPRQ